MSLFVNGLYQFLFGHPFTPTMACLFVSCCCIALIFAAKYFITLSDTSDPLSITDDVDKYNHKSTKDKNYNITHNVFPCLHCNKAITIKPVNSGVGEVTSKCCLGQADDDKYYCGS